MQCLYSLVQFVQNRLIITCICINSVVLDRVKSGKFGNHAGKELLAIRRIFSLVDMITNTKFSNCPNVFKIGVVWQ